MKNQLKELTKTSNGITLIALVVTIIVLLILAGISIQMLTGDNGILNRTTEARSETIHANVYEQLKFEELAYLSDKMTLKTSSTLIEYLQTKSIIGDEIEKDTGKYQVSVTALLGSKPSLGNGDATVELKDVYMLEKQSEPTTSSIVNTKVATTTPIKIAATTTSQVTYKVVYYGNDTSENSTLGSLTDSSTSDAKTDESAKLQAYFSKEEIWDDDNKTFKNIDPINDAADKLKDCGGGEDWTIVQYGEALYKVSFESETGNVSVSMIDIDLTKFGEYTIDGEKVLVTPSTPDHLIHLDYEEPNTYENMYYLKSNGKDVDLERPFTGSVYKADGLYYNSSGENIPVIQVSGPNTYSYYYYLKENGDIDYGRPFTEGYYSSDTHSYYDTSGALVHVRERKAVSRLSPRRRSFKSKI